MSRILTVDIVGYCGCCGATMPTHRMAWTGRGWLCQACIGGQQAAVLAQNARISRCEGRGEEIARLHEETHTKE